MMIETMIHDNLRLSKGYQTAQTLYLGKDERNLTSDKSNRIQNPTAETETVSGKKTPLVLCEKARHGNNYLDYYPRVCKVF